MSRLRQVVLSDRYFFVICNLLRTQVKLDDKDLAVLARVIAVRRGFVARPEDWPWSSVHDYGGMRTKQPQNLLGSGRVRLPADAEARI